MSETFLTPAQRINEAWLACAERAGFTIPLQNCPSNEQIAQIIQQACEEHKSFDSTEK